LKGKHLLLMSLILVMALCIIPGAQGEAAGKIALSPNSINLLVGEEMSVLPSWPDFDLTVEITDVTNAVAVAFSLEWDTTYFNCTGAVKGDVFEPGGGGGTYFALPNIKNDLGEFHEAAYTQLAPYDPQNLTDPTWGLVATVHFKYVGTTPSLGYPIETQINFTNYNTGALMRTYWAEKQAAPVPAQNDFSQILSCKFHYQVVETKTHDVLEFNVTTVSKSIVSNVTLVDADLKQLRFNVTGQAGMTSFCNVTIPKALLYAEPLEMWIVTVSNESPQSLVITDNTTHTFVDFTYNHTSTQQIIIQGTWVVPEFPTSTLLLLIVIATIAITTLGKKLWLTKRRENAISSQKQG
jgi:hypothetical protein